ncbi:MAG TPA: TldD/PmbA family protein [Candidatus Thermoplasmatota archaeon]|nr:TldD/PmbA family protein [Candidatus Thermoplasmatota archaeon]
MASSDEMDDMLGQAERLVGQAGSRGFQAEVYLERGIDLGVSLEKGAIAGTSTSQGSGGAWRVVQEGRLGFAYFTHLEDALRALEQAAAQSRHAPRKGFQLPSAAKPRGLPHRWDDHVAAFDVDTAMTMAQDVLAGAREGAPKALVTGGGAGLDASWRAIASTQGVAVADRETSASVYASLVQEDGERSVSGSEGRTRHDLKLDGHAVAMEAAATLTSLLKPKPVGKGGQRDIVFRPDAVEELVTGLIVSAATGDEARRGKTVWSDKLGQAVADRRFSLLDDSAAPGAVGGVPFDDEGLPTQPLPIVQDGVLRSFLYDAWDAHEHGAQSTRSGVRGDFKARVDTGTHHLVVTGTQTQALGKLIAGVDDGFLVDSVLGAHTANVTTGDFSVTAPSVWRIRKGQLAGAATEIAIGGNLPKLLQRLDGISTESKQMSGARIPHLLFRGVDVSV